MIIFIGTDMNINTLKIYMLLAMVSNSHAELIHEAYRFDVIDTQIHDDSWCRFQETRDHTNDTTALDHKIAVAGIHAAYQVRGNENKDLTPKQIEILDPLMNNSVRFAVKPQGIVCGEYAEQEAGIVSLITEQNGTHTLQITLRGTQSMSDVATDLHALKTYIPVVGAYAHKGIADRGEQLKNAMFEAVDQILEQKGLSWNDVNKVRFTGHSLGGALALYHATLFKALRPNVKTQCVTFNAPRLFDAKGTEFAENVLGFDNILRYWRESDPISAVSLGTQIGFGWFTGYKHAGKSLLLSSANGKGVHNHSSRHNLFDAFTLDQVLVNTQHKGVWERARDAKDSAVHAMSSTVSKIKNSVVNAASSLYNWAWGKK